MAPEAKKQNTTFERAVGRRKTAAARVRLYPQGTGTVTVNRKAFDRYFPSSVLRQIVTQPLSVSGKEKDFDISVLVVGGGKRSQAEAIRHAVARALVKWNEDLKSVLRAEGLLTRDAREKERKKFGLRKARRGRQWRKR